MYAEALNEVGRTDDAYDPIDSVRQRVNIPPLSQEELNLEQNPDY